MRVVHLRCWWSICDAGAYAGETEVGDGVGHICGGTSTATWKVWSQFGSQGLSVDVDTTKCNFENLQADKLKVPKYQTSIVGDSAHWQLTGVNSIYKATPTGFRLLLWPPMRPYKP